MKKAQIISFDLVISISIFAIVLVIVLTLFLLSSNQQDNRYDFELDFVFANVENNLRAYAMDSGNDADFVSNFRLNIDKLNTYVTHKGSDSIDDIVVGTYANTHGIGLSEDEYDACLYFTEHDGSRLSYGGISALGKVFPGGVETSCHDVLMANVNPCADYSSSISLLKPVLYVDPSDTGENIIMQMNIVLCKR